MSEENLTLVKDIPSHYLLDDVDSLDGGEKSYHSDLSLTSGAELVAHWSDGTTLIRLVNREHEGIVGLVYVEESTQGKLPSLRRNRPPKERMDSQVRDATTKAPPSSAGDKKKKKK